MNTKTKILFSIVVILLMIIAGVIGYKVSDIKNSNIANNTKKELVTDNNNLKQTVISQDVKKEEIITNPKDLLSYVNLTKDEVIQKLGKNYEMGGIGDDVSRGYYYPELGITFDFDDFYKKDNKVITINCNDKVEINGAKNGMKFEQIKQKLGPAKVDAIPEELSVHSKYYEINYEVKGAIITFASSFEDGTDSFLRIHPIEKIK